MRASLFVLFAIFCFVKCDHELDYGIMIDAGSSGSRIYLYEWPHRDHNTLPLVEPTSINQTVVSTKTNSPLSSFASNPSGAGPSLAPLIDYVKKYLSPAKYADTPIYLKATAGMRALAQADQDTIIANVRQYLATLPFKFTNAQEQAQVIPGTDEGIFGWITVNYALELLQKTNPTTNGALDMGGASTQITFVPQSPATSNAFDESLGPNKFNLYTYSYPLGQDQAGRLLLAGLLNDNLVDADGNILNPCYLLGYNETYAGSNTGIKVFGTGNYSACQSAVQKYIVVTANDCASTCGIGNVYQPAVYGNYYAFSGYAYTNDFFKLAPTSTISELITAGSAYCAQNFQAAKAAHPNDSDSFLKNYCFTSTYISEVLLKFGFSATSTQIHTQTNVGQIELTWALGGMIYEANLLPFGRDSAASSITSVYGLLIFVFVPLFLM